LCRCEREGAREASEENESVEIDVEKEPPMIDVEEEAN